MAKELGLIKHKNTLNFDKRMNLLKENIEYGNRMQEDARNNVELYNTQFNDEKISSMIYNLAESIATRKKIPLLDAMEEAKTIIENQTKK
jgi:hypothetical protein